jgi:hypothetical protein
MSRDIYFGANVVANILGIDLTAEQMRNTDVRKALYDIAVTRLDINQELILDLFKKRGVVPRDIGFKI